MIKFFFVSLLFLTSLFGEKSQNFSFMGVSASTQNINKDLGDSSWEGGVGIRYGQQSLDMRTLFILDYTQNAYYGASLEIDKILLDDMFGTPKLRPYLGGVVGYMHFDDDEVSRVYDDMDGFYYGASFGFIIYAADNVDVDLSYHYYKVENLDFLDDLHGATLAVHYFF